MAKKSLSERIADRAQRKQKKGRGGPNRAAFLAIRGEIAKALDDGWPVKEVWETLVEEGAIKFGYDAFLGYVKKLIQQPPPKVGRLSPALVARTAEAQREQPALRPTITPTQIVQPHHTQPVQSANSDDDGPQRVNTNHTSSFSYSPRAKKRDPKQSRSPDESTHDPSR